MQKFRKVSPEFHETIMRMGQTIPMREVDFMGAVQTRFGWYRAMVELSDDRFDEHPTYHSKLYYD
jgi:hypothetical protein